MPTRWFWAWPAVVGLSGLATGLALAFDLGGPLRVLLAGWFLLACPGLPFVRLLRLTSRMVELPLIVALSLSLDTLVATALVYAGLWSTANCLLILILISYVGAVLLFNRGYED